MNTPPSLLKHFDLSEVSTFVTVLTARQQGMNTTQLQQVLTEHQDFIQHTLHTRGVVAIRGVQAETPERFQDLVAQGLGVQPWNGFNSKGLPGFVSNWLRRYTEGLMGSGDYRRYVNKDIVQLGPVARSVQGPHVEGGGNPVRPRYLALCCFEPAEHQAETGMVDLTTVLQQLKPTTRQKYLQAFNTFYYYTARPLNWFDRLLVSQSPLRLMEESGGRAKLASAPTPAVCVHPVTGEACLQPWAFTLNTNGHAQASAERAWPDRAPLDPCPNAQNTEYLWGLCDADGKTMSWTEEEQQELFDTIYQRAFLMDWRKGDIALIDNVRAGHWRMNGVQGQRKLMQVQLGMVDAATMLPETLKGTRLIRPAGIRPDQQPA